MSFYIFAFSSKLSEIACRNKSYTSEYDGTYVAKLGTKFVDSSVHPLIYTLKLSDKSIIFCGM